MPSNKSRPRAGRGAVEPRRRPGKERVAALLESAAAVIAERGYEAATMAEIAARAGALVGSLYHFFPNKEALAEALIARYEGIVAEAFARVDAQASSLTAEKLAGALIGLLVGLQSESRAMIPLLDAKAEWSARREAFADMAVGHIARTLALHSPGLSAERPRDMAVVLLQAMKSMKVLVARYGDSGGPVAELRDMTRLYLAAKLAPTDDPAAPARGHTGGDDGPAHRSPAKPRRASRG